MYYQLQKTMNTLQEKLSNLKWIKEKREFLKELSGSLKDKLALARSLGADIKMNDLILIAYELEGKKVKTFKQWKEEGKTVKKGSKAYLFWSAPISKKKKEEDEKEEHTDTIFGIANLFSEEQVD